MELPNDMDFAIMDPQIRDGIWVDRDSKRAIEIFDEFNFKLGRENHFVEMNRKMLERYDSEERKNDGED